MTEPMSMWKGKAGWGAGGFAGGAAMMAVVWTAVGTRTPPEPVRRTSDVVLPYQAPAPVSVPQPVYTPVPIAQPVPAEAGVGEPLESTAIDNGVPPRTDVPAGDPLPEPARLPTVGLHRINLNTASEAELDLLPGIGPALAGRIIAERQRGGRFTSLRDLQRVSGIGPRTAEKLEGLVVFE